MVRQMRSRLVTWRITNARQNAGVLLSCGVAVILAASFPGSLWAQVNPAPSPLTLRQAVAMALERNPQHKVALADTQVAAADIRAARSALLPHATFSETATRGNDPVYVFGSKLRQQSFTAGDFALNTLNTPTPFSNFTTRFGATWNLFDSLASWRGIARAERQKESVGHQLERTDQEIVFRVVEAFYAVLLARKQLEVAEQSLKTGEAILGRSKDRFESGVVVESDYLSSQVRLASRRREIIGAQNNLAMAQAQLSVALGTSPGTAFDPAEALAEKNLPQISLEAMEKQALEMRPDLRRVRSEEAAQQQGVSIAKSAFGPRVNGFAAWQADNPTFFSGGGGNDWIAGIEIQVDLFQGGAKRAELTHQQALQAKAASVEEMAKDGIRIEVRRAYYEMDAARQQIDVARAAIAESQDSLRINQDRYDSGLSTISDLLAAEEAARRSQADYWETIYRYHTGYASLELAAGSLSPQSPVVIP